MGVCHAVGFDDAPFGPTQRHVQVVGAVMAGLRLDGVLTTQVRRDGSDATRRLVESVKSSRFHPQLHAVLLQGIALAGFNVVDIHGLHAALGIPVIAVARHRPDIEAIRLALLTNVPGGARKWRLVENAGPMDAAAGVYVQRAGIELADAARIIGRLAIHSRVPEPLRVAHLIAGGLVRGQSTSRRV